MQVSNTRVTAPIDHLKRINIISGCRLCLYFGQLLAGKEETMYHLWAEVGDMFSFVTMFSHYLHAPVYSNSW